MTCTVPWLSTPPQQVFWSQVVFLWMLANYGWSGSPAGRIAAASISPDERERFTREVWVRSAVAAVIVACLPGPTLSHLLSRLVVAMLTFTSLALLPLVRLKMATTEKWHAWLAEWEIACNVVFLALAAVVVAVADLTVVAPVMLIPVETSQFVGATLFVASVLFALKGGTHVIRGILDKTGALPLLPQPDSSGSSEEGSRSAGKIWTPDELETDVEEFNRGRMIGNLEQLLLLIFVVAGSFAAVGFLVAAKGLVRARELEDRQFSEYFLVGTLASVVLAVAVGMALKCVTG